MQSIFKYDVDRLQSYAANIQNNIKIVNEDDCLMLSFPDVGYFNYSFQTNENPLTKQQVKGIKDFYKKRSIQKHKIIVAANCSESKAVLQNDVAYKRTISIAKTVLHPSSYTPAKESNVAFIKVDSKNIECFTRTYLKSFESETVNYKKVLNNFEKLLTIDGLDLFLLQHNADYVGVNVFYKTKDESLLAGGAILTPFRNRGFHKSGLNFRMQLAMAHSTSNAIVAWAYKDSISLKNMLKLNMQIQQEFHVYEYCG